MILFKKYLGIAVFIYAFFASTVNASGISVTPSIVDEVVAARGLVERNLVITNHEDFKVSLYPFVNELSKSGGKQPFNAYAPDKTTSLSNWIDLSRKTIELAPGASTSVPLKIQAHPLAKEGKYYAVLSFIHGSSRPDAESRLNKADSEVLINLEVKENKIERCEIGTFNAGSFFNFNKKALLEFSIRNSGNQVIAPSGSVVIYDSRGREVAELKVNEEGKTINADDKEFYKLNWDCGNSMGKYKAKLSLQYGDVTKRDIQDSVYFWVLPKWFLGLVGFLVLMLFVSIMMLVMRLNRLKKSLSDDERGDIINLRDR